VSLALTVYENQVCAEVAKWRERSPSRGARVFGKVTKIVEKPTEWLMDKTVLGKVMAGVLAIAMDAGSWAVPEQKVLQGFRSRGLNVLTFADIRQTVPLEDRDREAARLAKFYRSQLGAEGAAAGASALMGPEIGVPALMADIAFVTTWACRAAAHHAAVYGYRTETPPERAMAMQILVGATSATDSAKQAALANVLKLSRQIAQKKTWEELEKNALVRTIQEAADQLGVRLTKAKLGQVVAVVGVIIGAGYNVWYIDKVCEWGYWTYRAHYLEDKMAGFPRYDQAGAEGRSEEANHHGNP
jgi:hypothetical protein